MKIHLFKLICFAFLLTILFSCNDDRNQIVNVPFENEEFNSLEKSSREKIEFPGVPFWSRSWLINQDLGEYACIYFYVKDPNTIPDDHNLIAFWDLRALDPSTEWAVQGYQIIEEGQTTPVRTSYTENGKVPFWFIPSELGKELFANGYLTMPQLRALNPIKGYATDFKEHILLMPSYPVNIIKTRAKGYFDDGRSFNINFVHNFDFAEVDKFSGHLIIK